MFYAFVCIYERARVPRCGQGAAEHLRDRGRCINAIERWARAEGEAEGRTANHDTNIRSLVCPRARPRVRLYERGCAPLEGAHPNAVQNHSSHGKKHSHNLNSRPDVRACSIVVAGRPSQTTSSHLAWAACPGTCVRQKSSKKFASKIVGRSTRLHVENYPQCTETKTECRKSFRLSYYQPLCVGGIN